jgi:hypothetical protein
MASANVTRRALTLGDRDITTRWCSKLYTESTIKGSFDPASIRSINLPISVYSSSGRPFFTAQYVRKGDQIVHSVLGTFVLTSVEPWSYLDHFNGYACTAEKVFNPSDRAATSGTWHSDSESVTTDPRNRLLTWLDTYISYSAAVDQTMYAGLDYPVEYEFTDNHLELICAVDVAPSKPEYNANHYPYKFVETVNLHLYAMDTAMLTAANILESYEQAVRKVASDHPIGSIRKIESTKPERVNIGGYKYLWTQTITISYIRVNDDYTPTAPSFDYGIAFIYEGDRVSGGTEGTWTLTQGAGSTCTQAVTSDKNLYLDQTVYGADSSTVNGTNLALPSTTYGRIKIRYKTSGAATAKVVLGFSAGVQTVLAESASTYFTVADVAITTAKTINTITLYACDGVGTVTYDFIEIYTGQYILPNVTEMNPPFALKDVVIKIPGMSGNPSQALGSNLVEVTMTCDLDMEPAALHWKRPQATGATDVNKTDILYETQHLEGINQPWVWLDLGDPAMQFKARLINISPIWGERGKVDLLWREYRHGNASGETTSERFGLSL